jgi:hypothetical protein
MRRQDLTQKNQPRIRVGACISTAVESVFSEKFGKRPRAAAGARNTLNWEHERGFIRTYSLTCLNRVRYFALAGLHYLQLFLALEQF